MSAFVIWKSVAWTTFGICLGNFAYQAATRNHNYAIAVERSFFQVVAVAAVVWVLVRELGRQGFIR